jgi:DNA-binding response OmpR family regulator
VRVLVAEDDDTLGAVLAQGLRSRGYVVDLVADGEAALSYARCYEYAVAVLDWLIPRVSGIDVVRQLRRTGARTPVLMISGKGAPEDRVAGLDAGADDYLVKPFVFDELLARLRALQRRPPDVLPPRLVVGDLECDPASREVTFSGRRPALTSTELSILETLMRFSPAVAERRQIAQHVWTDEVDTFSSNTIDVHLARLRAKLSGSRVRIQTVRGVGYRIVADNGQRLAGRRELADRPEQEEAFLATDGRAGQHTGAEPQVRAEPPPCARRVRSLEAPVRQVLVAEAPHEGAVRGPRGGLVVLGGHHVEDLAAPAAVPGGRREPERRPLELGGDVQVDGHGRGQPAAGVAGAVDDLIAVGDPGPQPLPRIVPVPDQPHQLVVGEPGVRQVEVPLVLADLRRVGGVQRAEGAAGGGH